MRKHSLGALGGMQVMSKRGMATFVSKVLPGTVSGPLEVPAGIKRPPFRDNAPISIKSAVEVEAMRSTGQLAGRILNFACEAALVGSGGAPEPVNSLPSPSYVGWSNHGRDRPRHTQRNHQSRRVPVPAALPRLPQEHLHQHQRVCCARDP